MLTLDLFGLLVSVAAFAGQALAAPVADNEIIQVYHTDANGMWSRAFNPLCQWTWTDMKGKVEATGTALAPRDAPTSDADYGVLIGGMCFLKILDQ